jgi:hypothetical protein
MSKGIAVSHSDSAGEVRIFCRVAARFSGGLVRIRRSKRAEMLQIASGAAKKYQGFKTHVVAVDQRSVPL